MIDAVMYGMMPSANTLSRNNAPPENRFSTVNRSLPLPASSMQLVDRAVGHTRRRDGGTQPVDGDHGEREEDLLAQIGRLQRRSESGEQ